MWIPEPGGGGGSGGAFSGVRLVKSSAQSLSPNTDTVVTWATEVFDTDGYADLGTNNTRISITDAGKYLVGFTIRFGSGNAGFRLAYVREGGTDPIGPAVYQRGGSTGVIVVTGSGLLDLAASDYLEIVVNSAQAVDVETTFTAFWLERRD